jgi:hypothetical protein
MDSKRLTEKFSAKVNATKLGDESKTTDILYVDA